MLFTAIGYGDRLIRMTKGPLEPDYLTVLHLILRIRQLIACSISYSNFTLLGHTNEGSGSEEKIGSLFDLGGMIFAYQARSNLKRFEFHCSWRLLFERERLAFKRRIKWQLLLVQSGVVSPIAARSRSLAPVHSSR